MKEIRLKPFINLLKQGKIVSVTFPTGKAINYNAYTGKYTVVSTATAINLVAGIWLTIQNFPGRNRGFKSYLYSRLPVEVKPEVVSLDKNLELWGRVLQLHINIDELEKIDELIERFGKLCLAAIYIYGKEDKS